MGDVWATVADADTGTQEMLADAMVQRGEDPDFTALREAYFQWLPPLVVGDVIEMGCGPGDVTAALATHCGARTAIGIDPSPVMIERAKARHAGKAGFSFAVGDARNTDLPDASADLILFHTTLCHVPGPEAALAEVMRLLRPGGWLVVFDGDYASATAALSRRDPIDQVIQKAGDELIHDRYFCRSLPALLRAAGLQLARYEVLNYLASGNAAFFLSLLDRGLIFLQQDGLCGPDSAKALRAEADARIASGRFFGFTAFHAAFARKQEAQT